MRANLIDKDRNPKWQPPPSPGQVEEYFQNLSAEEELSLPVYSTPPQGRSEAWKRIDPVRFES